MPTSEVTLITIIAEDVLEERIVRDLKKFGIKGYTATDAHGSGHEGSRTSEWDGKNIRIEILSSGETVTKIMWHLHEKYFEKYAVIAWHHPVQVLRKRHFTGSE